MFCLRNTIIKSHLIHKNLFKLYVKTDNKFIKSYLQIKSFHSVNDIFNEFVRTLDKEKFIEDLEECHSKLLFNYSFILKVFIY